MSGSPQRRTPPPKAIQQKFFDALFCHDYAAMDAALAQGADIDRGSEGKTIPLNIGVIQNNPFLIDWLLQRGANPFASKHDACLSAYRLNRKPLFDRMLDSVSTVPYAPSVELLHTLIEHRAESDAVRVLQKVAAWQPNVSYDRDQDPVRSAAAQDMPRLLKLFQEKGEDLARSDGRAAATLMLLAVEKEATRAMAYLHSEGIPVDRAYTCDGASPTYLCLAVASDSAGSVDWLLENGVDPNPRPGESSPLLVAVVDRKLGHVKALVAHGADLQGFGAPANAVPVLPPSKGTPPTAILLFLADHFMGMWNACDDLQNAIPIEGIGVAAQLIQDNAPSPLLLQLAGMGMLPALFEPPLWAKPSEASELFRTLRDSLPAYHQPQLDAIDLSWAVSASVEENWQARIKPSPLTETRRR